MVYLLKEAVVMSYLSAQELVQHALKTACVYQQKSLQAILWVLDQYLQGFKFFGEYHASLLWRFFHNSYHTFFHIA